MNELSKQSGQEISYLQPPSMQQQNVNAGAIAIESERAIAEARGQMQLAKMFPRSVTTSIAEFMEACKSKDFAETAFYSVQNRGSGPSIRFAEEAARCYGNFEYGHRELSRSEGKSEIEVYAWDKEKNNQSKRQITVMHVRDTRDGAKKLTDQADIDNKIANVASKQIRGRILALLPKHMVAAGINEAKRTLAGGNEKPLRDRIIAMCSAFAKFGVTTAHITKYLGHDTDSMTLDEFADLTGIFNNLRDGGKVDAWFPAEKPALTAPEAPAAANENSTSTKPAATKKAATKAADPAPAEEAKQDAPATATEVTAATAPAEAQAPALQKPANEPQQQAQTSASPTVAGDDLGDVF